MVFVDGFSGEMGGVGNLFPVDGVLVIPFVLAKKRLNYINNRIMEVTDTVIYSIKITITFFD